MKYLLFILLLGIVSCKDSNSSKKKDEIKNPKEITLEGTYLSNDNLLYKSFTFKGKSTVVIKDGLIGFDFVTSYERDENFIRVKTDKSDLLLQLVTKDSLIGEGFAKGSFVKVKE